MLKYISVLALWSLIFHYDKTFLLQFVISEELESSSEKNFIDTLKDTNLRKISVLENENPGIDSSLQISKDKSEEKKNDFFEKNEVDNKLYKQQNDYNFVNNLNNDGELNDSIFFEENYQPLVGKARVNLKRILAKANLMEALRKLHARLYNTHFSKIHPKLHTLVPQTINYKISKVPPISDPLHKLPLLDYHSKSELDKKNLKFGFINPNFHLFGSKVNNLDLEQNKKHVIINLTTECPLTKETQMKLPYSYMILPKPHLNVRSGGQSHYLNGNIFTPGHNIYTQ